MKGRKELHKIILKSTGRANITRFGHEIIIVHQFLMLKNATSNHFQSTQTLTRNSFHTSSVCLPLLPVFHEYAAPLQPSSSREEHADHALHAPS